MFRQYFKTLFALFIGGAIGVGVMWLMAPMSGGETRQYLKDNFARMQLKAGTSLENAQSKARQITDIGRRVVDEQKSSLDRGVEEVKSVATS